MLFMNAIPKIHINEYLSTDISHKHEISLLVIDYFLIFPLTVKGNIEFNNHLIKKFKMQCGILKIN